MYSRLAFLDKICISLETYAHMENILRLRLLEKSVFKFIFVAFVLFCSINKCYLIRESFDDVCDLSVK